MIHAILLCLATLIFVQPSHALGIKLPGSKTYDTQITVFDSAIVDDRLAGAHVIVDGAVVNADENGVANFKLKSGAHSVIIQQQGYDDFNTNIEVSGNGAFYYGLSPNALHDVIVRVYDGGNFSDNKRLKNARVTLAGVTETSDDFGFTLFHVKRGVYNLKVEANYFGTSEMQVTIRHTLNQENDQIRVGITRSTPEWAIGEDLLHVLANFCNLKDSKDRVIFTPFIASLDDADRADWYARQRDAGSTHTVLSPAYSYGGSPIPGKDMLGNPQEFRKYVLEALNTPSADGKGFRPILILDGGDRDPRPRIAKYWPPLIEAIRDLLPFVIVVPGWELIRASDWTSADLSYSLNLLHNLQVPHMWLHLSPGRGTGSSNPVEADDPWQGGESDMWKSNGGQYLEGFLYQSEPLRDGDNPYCDPSTDACWLNRWEDIVPRLGNGMNGWRPVRLVLFENIAFYYYRNMASEALVRDMATAGLRMCEKYKVKCGFGNGLPR